MSAKFTDLARKKIGIFRILQSVVTRILSINLGLRSLYLFWKIILIYKYRGYQGYSNLQHLGKPMTDSDRQRRNSDFGESLHMPKMNFIPLSLWIYSIYPPWRRTRRPPRDRERAFFHKFMLLFFVLRILKWPSNRWLPPYRPHARGCPRCSSVRAARCR